MSNPKSVSLLIIDDNEDFLKTISAHLVEHYPREISLVGTARSGREGVRLARQLNPQVVLLDLKMPEMHGFDVIPLLRQALPNLKIITTTLLPAEVFEQAGDIYIQTNASAGADGFIPKFMLTLNLVPAIQAMAQSTGHLEVTS